MRRINALECELQLISLYKYQRMQAMKLIKYVISAIFLLYWLVRKNALWSSRHRHTAEIHCFFLLINTASV